MKKNHFIFFGIVLFCLGAALFATQTKNDKPTKQPPRAEPTVTTQSQRNQPREQRPVFLMGTVLMEDGSRPPDSVRVELSCNGQTQKQSFLDPHDNFTFEIGGQSSPGWMDASVSGGSGFGSNRGVTQSSINSPFGSMDPLGGTMSNTMSLNLNGCEIRLMPVAGFTATRIILGTRSALDNPDVGTIVLQRLDRSGGTVISLKALAAPAEAKKYFSRAEKELSKKEVDHKKVVKELLKAVEAYPEFSTAWYLIGESRSALGEEALAREAFNRAIESDDRYLNPYLAMASIELRAENWQSASKFTTKIVELAPEAPQGRYFHGLAQYNLGALNEAEESFRYLETQGRIQDFPMTLFFLGLIDAQAGRVETAALELRGYLAETPQENIPPGLKELIHEQLNLWQQGGLIQTEEAPSNAETP